VALERFDDAISIAEWILLVWFISIIFEEISEVWLSRY
jgi:hypothetical protein